jgi:hypothetical protein
MVAAPGREVAAPVRVAAVPPNPATMWNLMKIRWNEARVVAGFRDAQDITVAVLDTGIQTDHPDLAGRVAGHVFSYPADVQAPSGPEDIIGHGSHVAGTIGANFNNNVGINGICNCKLKAWKIFDDRPDYSALDNMFVYYVNPSMYRMALGRVVN